MSRIHRSPLAIAAGLSLALTALGLAGCAKKLPVDPRDWGLVAFPEGRRDTLERTPSDLVVWPDVPVDVTDTSGDTVTYTFYRSGPGAVVGAICDYSEASAYEVFRREYGTPSGTSGYRQFTDFPLAAHRRWPDRDYYGLPGRTVALPPAQLFTFTDPAPPAIALKGYVGRAVNSGQSSANHPRTNLGETAGGAAIAALPTTLRPVIVAVGDTTVLVAWSFEWEEVVGAAGYWIHAFELRKDIVSLGDVVEIVLPAPITFGKVKDQFLAYIPAPATSFRTGEPLPPGGRALVYRGNVFTSLTLLRISAVNASGEMIATTGGAGDLAAYETGEAGQGHLLRFPLGAVAPRVVRGVALGADKPPGASAVTGQRRAIEGEGEEVLSSGVRGLTYQRGGAPGLFRDFTRRP